MTNHWIDFRNADVIMSVGGNHAENHPISMKWVTEAKLKGAKLIHVDPRFNRTAAVADIYAPLRSGTDVGFLGGLINYVLKNNLYHKEYVENYTTASWLVSNEYSFEEGIFSGYDAESRKYDNSKWDYLTEGKDKLADLPWVKESGVPTFDVPITRTVQKDLTLQNPRCVFQIIKKHFSRYSPDAVSRITGMPKEKFLKIAELFGSTGESGKAGTILYAMGLTQHTNGSQIVRCLAMLQLLLGNVGIAGGGVNALRGESNVQGSTDLAMLFHLVPAYMAAPRADAHFTLADYLTKETMAEGYWQNKPKFFVSLLKAMYGDKATLKNEYAYHYLPKLGNKNYSHIALFEAINERIIKGLFLWGQNPAVSGPNSRFERKALEKLEWMVCIDLWNTESASFWHAPGVDSEKIETEVFLLPAAAHFEKEGSVTNSGRWIQWRWKAVEPFGEAKSDLWIIDRLFKEINREYIGGTGRAPGAILDLKWDYGEEEPDVRKVAVEINGYTLGDGKPITNFSELEADGSTACGCWIYSGYYNDEGEPVKQPTGRRDNKDSTGIGSFLDWSFSWPSNRRILYNRASANLNGEPYDHETPIIFWTGISWQLNDMPDFSITNPDGTPKSPDANAFIMLSEGAGKLFAKEMKDGPLPEHYESVESPARNLLSKQQNNPVVILWESANLARTGSKEFPIVMTTFRLAEHWQTGSITRNLPWQVESMPYMFVEISEELAAEKGVTTDDFIVIYNNRGAIEARVLVTKRMKPFKIGDKVVHQIAAPWHWGFAGSTIGGIVNDLTPNVGDANTMIPEYKAFLVNIRKKV